MAALFAAIAVFLLIEVINCESDQSFCTDDETKVKTRWIFTQDTTCAAKISEVTGFYNEDYRLECQWWQDLSSPPDKISKAFVTECFPLINGTIKYRAKVCCPGAVTRQRCFTCDSRAWQHDSQRSMWHSERCNHFVSRPVLCNAGEVCQTTLGYNTSKTVSKFCAPKASCIAKSSDNRCQSGEAIPSCTYCCEGPFCNYETPMPWFNQITKNNGCEARPCLYNGECVANETDPRGYSCLCKPGTWGPRCQNWMYIYQPCDNRASIRRTTVEPYYHCYCRAGYKGVNCTEDYPTCNDDVAYCLNGGTCFDQGTFGRRCRCASGFIGTNCEIKTSQVCAHGARYFPFGQSTSISAAKNCTQKNKLTSRQLTAYLYSCKSLMGSRFVEGVHGHVAKVESIALRYCERGDEATWYSTAICCPACMNAPCQNDGWCIQGGDDYVCQCRVGYEGKNCENKVAICYVSGDPHYRTFDGLMLHYQGVCRYNLASSQQHYPDLPYFRVLAKSEHRYGTTHVSYTRYVDVEVFGHTVRLDKGKKVYVDDVLVQPDATYPGFEITNNGRFVRLATNFSLVVESDGDWLSVVKAPSSFAGKMAGLCGNADGNPENDWRTSNGSNVKDLPNKYSLIGNSWQVEDQEDANCTTTNDTDPQECDEAEAMQVSGNTYCGLLNATDGIFRDCIRNAPSLAASYLENCRFDVCANMAIATSAKRAACGTLEAFSAQCSDLGYGQVDWRTVADCPLDCGPDMVYQLSAPACLPTCSKPNAPEECSLPKTESCVCADSNAVVVGGQCVSAQTCGCTDDNGVHHEIGAQWLNDGCTMKLECVVCQSCNRPVGEIVARASTCEEGYYCSSVNGVAHCQKAQDCGPDMVYQLSAPACLATCSKPNAPEECGLPKTDSCVCADNDSVVVDGKCVSAQTCGCTDDNGVHYAIGAQWLNDGCTMKLECVVCQSCNRPVGEIVARASTCEEGYYCSSVNGVAHCQKAQDCGPDMVYQLSAPACLPTCSKPNAPEECGLPKTDSCVCADNDSVVVDGKCVSAQTCGCTDDNGVHYAIGAQWLNDGCTMELECVVCQSCNRPVGEIVARASTCKEGYYCSSVNGVAHCQKAQDCGPDMVYQLSAPACLPTCSKPNAPEECGLPKTDSCVCADNDSVVVDGKCVSAQTCGCTDDNGVHYAIGAQWLNVGCTMELECVVCQSCNRPVGEIVSRPTACKNGYKCFHENGVAHCQKSAQWGEWLSWGDCSESCGKGIQTRTRSCTKQDRSVVDEAMCDGTAADTRDCVCETNFSAAVDCKKCNKTSNYIGYVADKCDCSIYYQCHLANGEWTATLMSCPRCQHWDSAMLTCVVSQDTTCETVTTSEVTGQICNLRTVDNDVTKYAVPAPGQDVIMSCPVGTVFSLLKCTCVWASSIHTTTQQTLTTTAVAIIPEEITCVNFDAGWNGFGATHWVYVQPINVDRESSAFVGSAAKFNGSGRLEIPRFSNSYGNWKQFAVSFCYKRSSVGGTATQGLVSNGNCVSAPSISITSGQGTIAAHLSTESGTVTISGIVAADNVWHHVVLSYDGKQVHLCVDGTCYLMGHSHGAISERHCPMVIGQLEASRSGFTGYMDELCFYQKALPEGVVKRLQNTFFPVGN